MDNRAANRVKRIGHHLDDGSRPFLRRQRCLTGTDVTYLNVEET